MLDAEVFDKTVSIGPRGFQLGVPHPLDVSLASSSGVYIQPGKEVFVAVTASIIETGKEVRQRFGYNSTKCHFDDEVELDHFPTSWYRYSMNNCMLESYVQKVEELCNCSDIVAGTKRLEVCSGDGLRCAASKGRHYGIRNKGQQM